jgi:type I restriction-modification system DNA methylase subunit
MSRADAESIQAPQIIKTLVARFAEHREAYQQQTYNETQVRREFIDPFFKALGWDIDNEQGAAEAYKDVIHEDAIKIGGATKAPDYCFRIGGTRKFFVEAKKPSIGVADDPGPAYQVRRYAWTSKLPLSIVTDFDEFAVYDCRIPPKPNDKATVARVLYLTCDQYVEKWAEIASIFSKDAVLKGSFDKYAESNRRKKGTAEVDAEILKEIESWREALAKNFALRNEKLSVRDLNFAVGRTIDRIIFLRMCEDRSIEPYGRLQGLLGGPEIYSRLGQLFREADDKYNAGLFYFRQEADRGPPDELTLALELDDKVLRDIIKRLYYPESPYEFSVLPPEILGQVYEQFLGKVITLTAGHRAKVYEKPEVRKAGGVYYTPTYIVDYIVKNTVGKLLEGKTPADVGPERETKTGKRRKVAKGAKMLRVLDPACGSGSFLLGAYQYLLDWHRDWYVAQVAPGDLPGAKSNAYSDRLYQHSAGQWRLSIREKKRILLNNIYGVDIDAQAVEVTKLSLLLKVLEGETAETIGSTMRLFHERALPDLSDNIKCGNSLIGPDFYEGKQLKMFDDEHRYRINVFNWNAEFAEIMEAGGFDSVIGNPPYVNAWDFFDAMPEVREFINSRDHYSTADRHWDLYVVFLELSHRLLRSGGRMSFIIPYSYAIQKYAQASRNHFLQQSAIESIADLRRVRVFGRVPVITIIPLFIKGRPSSNHGVSVVRPSADSTPFRVAEFQESHKVQQDLLAAQHEQMLRLDMSPGVADLISKIQGQSIQLGTICYINYGAQMSSKKKGDFGKERVIRSRKESKDCFRMISGRDLYRYKATWAGKYVDWSLAPKMYGPRWPEFFETPKLMIRDITGTHRIEATLDDCGLYCDHTILCALRKCDLAATKEIAQEEVDAARGFDLRYLCGIVASRMVSAFCYFVLTGEGVRTGGGFHTYPHTIRKFPIRPMTSTDPEKKTQDQIMKKVDQVLSLHKSLTAAKTAHDKTALQRQIDATDKQIDQLVYQLYGLTDEEIRIVEEATR